MNKVKKKEKIRRRVSLVYDHNFFGEEVQEKFAWQCVACGRVWYARHQAQNCKHKDLYWFTYGTRSYYKMCLRNEGQEGGPQSRADTEMDFYVLVRFKKEIRRFISLEDAFRFLKGVGVHSLQQYGRDEWIDKRNRAEVFWCSEYRFPERFSVWDTWKPVPDEEILNV